MGLGTEGYNISAFAGTTKTEKRIRENDEVAYSGMGLGAMLFSVIAGVFTRTSTDPFWAVLGFIMVLCILGGTIGLFFGIGTSIGRQLRSELSAFNPDAKSLSSWDTWMMMLSFSRKKTILTYENKEDSSKKQAIVTSGYGGTTLEIISIPNKLELWDLSASAVCQAYGVSQPGKK